MSIMKDRMHTGQMYLPHDDEIIEWQTKCLDRLYEFNATRPTEGQKRQKMLSEMFAEIGEGCYIEPPFHANFGGAHVHFGKKIYANFNLTCVDDTHIYIGDYTMIGPNVTIATAGHPILPELRSLGYQYNAEVHIGQNCWIGAGAVILPGITVGDNVVIGAGSVVTKDLPSGVIAVGNPCRVLREVDERDKKYYFKNKLIDWEDIEMSNEVLKVDSRCGLHCTGCEYKESCGCGGCIETDGHPFHGECPVAICCQNKGFVHCGECPDMPCEQLTQYSCDPEHGDTPCGARIEQCKRWREQEDRK